ncbi:MULTISPECIES: thiol:disulfide interchange protein DsbA/DsbL [unclassified Candidatus Accumulibacter]|jgi:thiol:disulfide interchange protein DsbA|uniref:thiol:disulfide interchange protein DsbA/DsbL n=1 Tax=unclassified Candidatus Accumulibacter TaxID=2619054 RepID=UPI0012CB54D4|nr:thiol:disulfide interchange protein DsbA/DsbL [Candidatus Accumulibacter sp. ACC005]MQM35208.1 twin-arginine translocation pathway signal protein [Candidatus Accumulibacter phosphatis]HRI92614.1 thiol:disulfide interchange protein DsbA/DsbL [Accumulibacter sp.]
MQGRISGWFAAITLALLAMALPARAELVADRDYVAIVPAQISDNPAKIEVLEFFSYGCPHCADFHPLVSRWAEALPSDVVFKRVPVSFGRPQWASLARLYYALEASGDLAKLDGAVFRALHQENKRLFDDKSIIAWVTAQGVDGKKFTAAYNSFGVLSQAKRADQMAQAYKIQGVPALAVAGRYLVAGKDLKGYGDLLALTDQVIAKARSEQQKK